MLSHLRSRLSIQSTRALMCLGAWSELGYVNATDIKSALSLPEIPADENEEDLPQDWDAIQDFQVV